MLDENQLRINKQFLVQRMAVIFHQRKSRHMAYWRVRVALYLLRRERAQSSVSREVDILEGVNRVSLNRLKYRQLTVLAHQQTSNQMVGISLECCCFGP